MSDFAVNEMPEGVPLLDNDGLPISELSVDSVDELHDVAVGIAQLAANQREWRFGHVIVDEAQDLTPMQWRMIARRASGASVTIVGDLAQRSIGEPGSWDAHLPESFADFAYAELSINYRSPAAINELAALVLAELAPGLTAPAAIRETEAVPVAIAVETSAERRTRLAELVAAEQLAVPGGQVAVIGADVDERLVESLAGTDAVVLTAWRSKGLEFDSVIVVEPAEIAESDGGLSLLYVALTRSTDRLTILHRRPLPTPLASHFAT